MSLRQRCPVATECTWRGAANDRDNGPTMGHVAACHPEEMGPRGTHELYRRSLYQTWERVR